MSAIQYGTVKRLLVERGFGFITGDDGVDRFFHRRDLTPNSGAYFPANMCICGHASSGHAGSDSPPEGACTLCACQQYARRPSPAAISPGFRVQFIPDHDDRGPRASQIAPVAVDQMRTA